MSNSYIRITRLFCFASFDVLILLLFVLNSLFVVIMLDLNMNDFGKFYYSAVDFLNGRDMYGPSPATLIPVGDGESRHFWNLNPPHFHLLILPLALATPAMAVAIWGAVSLSSLIASLSLIGRELQLKLTPWRRRLIIFGLLIFAGTHATLATGQLSFVLLLPVTLAWIAARRGCWTLAGICLGAGIGVKVYLLIFLPYMLLRGEFRAVIAACGTAAASLLLGLLVFGLDAYWSWVNVLTKVNWAWAPMNGSVLAILARALSENPYYAPLAIAPGLITPLWLAGASLIGVITYAITKIDRTETSVDRGFALLLIGAQLISPLGWIYYLCLSFGPLTSLTGLYSRTQAICSATDTLYWRIGLFIALLGLAVPVIVHGLVRPYAWAGVTIGSVYFWATFALWCTLVLDGLRAVRSNSGVNGSGS